MKATQFIAAIAVFAATGAAFAQPVGYVNPAEGFQSTKSAAEVRAEVVQAYNDGTLKTNDAVNAPVASASQRTRAEVRAEQASAPRQPSLNVHDTYFGA
jgi:hypothetical protein